MNWYVRDFSAKVGLVLVAAIVSLMIGVALISVAGNSVASVFLAGYLLAVVGFTARRFRGPSEPGVGRPWWQMTAGMGWSVVWAVKFLADAVATFVVIVAARAVTPALVAALLVQAFLVAAYLNSALRLGARLPSASADPTV